MRLFSDLVTFHSLLFLIIFDFYCCQNIQIQWLKIIVIIILKFCRLTDLSKTSLTGPRSRGQPGCVPYWRLLRRIYFQASHVVGRIQFHVPVRLRPLFSCWVSTRGHSQLLEAFCIPWLITPLIFKTTNNESSPSHALNLSDFPLSHFTHLTLLPSSFAFKDSDDHIWTTWIIQANLCILRLAG